MAKSLTFRSGRWRQLISFVGVLGTGLLTLPAIAPPSMAQPQPCPATATSMPQPPATVTGTVFYRPRIALPPGAALEVKLVDVSRADAPARLLAEHRMVLQKQQVPLPFTLTYDPSQVEPRYTYAVQARILVDGKLRWISTRRYAVITRDNPSDALMIEVEPVMPAPRSE